MPDLEQLSVTLEKIYAAAADPSLWEHALVAIEDFTGSTGAVLDFVPKDRAVLPRTMAGSFTHSDCAEYALQYQSICPRIAYAISHADAPVHFDQMVLSETEMDLDPVYEWLGKYGLRYYVAGWVGDGRLFNSYLSLQRSRRQGHVQIEQIEQFALIKRHVAQALSLALKIGTLERQCRFGLGLLEALPYAVFALDFSGRVLFLNCRAESLVQRKDGVLVRDGRLQAQMAQQQPLLDRLIQAATSPDTAQVRGGWVRLHRTSGRRPYLALVSEFASAQQPVDDLSARALVIVSNPDDATIPDEQALRELYDVTISEARVAVAIARGHSVQSASEHLQISPETLRTHLKHVFRKLGVSRQQDLVRQLVEVGFIGGGMGHE
jgi:DNA-binding CsgD family transcriptional regulator